MATNRPGESIIIYVYALRHSFKEGIADVSVTVTRSRGQANLNGHSITIFLVDVFEANGIMEDRVTITAAKRVLCMAVIDVSLRPTVFCNRRRIILYVIGMRMRRKKSNDKRNRQTKNEKGRT